MYTLITENSYFIPLSKIYTHLYQEHIMREKVRGEEHDMTTHLIRLYVFTHTSCVTKFSASLLSRQRET